MNGKADIPRDGVSAFLFYGTTKTKNMASDFTQQAAQYAPTVASKIAYGASASGLVVAGLTVNEVVGVAVGAVSIVTMVATAIVNARHKKKAAELIEIQIERERRRT